MQNNKPKLKFFRNKNSEEDVKTVQGLAMTPAQMMSLAEKGIPISNQALNAEYYDGDSNIDWNVPLDRQRSVDVNEMWNKKEDVKKAMKKMTKEEIKFRKMRKEFEEGGN